jgi:hypothetical protein
MNLTIKDIIKDNSVKFREYRKGILYYQIVIMNDVSIEDAGLYTFPVPLEDCGDATFKASDKACCEILLYRAICKISSLSSLSM